MKQLRLVFSDAAIIDMIEQADWYTQQSGETLARRWEKAVTAAVLRIVKNPAVGTPCNFRSSELHDTRRTTVSGFPRHLPFYRSHKQEVLILRVLHGARDLENLL